MLKTAGRREREKKCLNAESRVGWMERMEERMANGTRELTSEESKRMIERNCFRFLCERDDRRRAGGRRGSGEEE